MSKPALHPRQTVRPQTDCPRSPEVQAASHVCIRATQMQAKNQTWPRVKNAYEGRGFVVVLRTGMNNVDMPSSGVLRL